MPQSDKVRMTIKVEIGAACLPEGSVVATGDTVWIARASRSPFRWESFDGWATDGGIDYLLLGGGAQVLRVGAGEECWA
jgi:hypothetical protein